MKKLLLILSFLVCAVTSFSQSIQTLGAPGTNVVSRGMLSADSALGLRNNFIDTLNANKGYIKNNAGAIIRTGNTVWVRDSTATSWVQMGSGGGTSTNIYNSDGLLTADRVLSGSSTHSLTFDSLTAFGTFSYTDNANYTQIQQDPNEVSIINIHNSVDSHVAVDAGIVQIRAEDSVRISYDGAAPSTAVLGTNRIQVRSPSGGLLDYTGTIGGGGDSLFGQKDTLFAASRYTNAAGYTFKHKSGVDVFGGIDSVGNRINYSWGTNPLSATVWNSSGTAPTTNGTSTTINGTNNITSVIHTGPENETFNVTFITNVKTTSTQNISISLHSDTLGSVTDRRFVFVLRQDSGYINYYGSDAGLIPNYSSKATTSFVWSAGDTMDCQIIYRRGTIYATMRNRANGQKSILSASPGNVANVGTVLIATVGNFTYLNNFTYSIDEQVSPKFLLTGNSTAIGSGASNTFYRWWDDLFRNYSDLHVVSAGAGERSVQGLQRIQEIIYYNKPRYVVYEYGVNDLSGGSIALFSANTRRFADSMNAHGIGLIFISLVPQAASVQTYNDTLQAIATAKGGLFINISTILQNLNGGGFNKNTIYQPTGDLVHLNDLGQQLESDIVAKNILSLLNQIPTVVFDKMPSFTANYKSLIGLNDLNQQVIVPDGVSPGYIWNKQFQLSQTFAGSAQVADIFITGKIYSAGEILFQGNGNVASPSFSVSVATGVTNAASFSANAGEFTVAGGQVSVTANWMQFLNAARIRTQSNNPMKISTVISGPNAGTIGLWATTETTIPGQAFLPFAAGSGDSAYLFVGRYGGLNVNYFGRGGNGARFQVKGLTDTALIATDPSNDAVGFGTIAPREKVDINGILSLRNVPVTTDIDSMLSMTNGRVNKIDASAWGRIAGQGITNTAGTWTADLSTGIAGGQTVRGGTAANDQLLFRGTIVASGSTLTNPNMTFIAGDGAGLTAAQILNNGTVSARYLTGTTAVGSIAAGAGAGTTPTVSISGTDLGGFISVTTGTVPTLSATVVTITFGNAYPSAPKSIILTPANSNAALLSGVTSVFVDQSGISTTTFTITAGTTALASATAYKFYYQVIQ